MIGGENTEVAHSDQLALFCRDFVSRYPKQLVTEEMLARHFVSFFKISPFVHMANLTEFCKSVGIVLWKEILPPDLMGINGSVGNLRKVIISDRAEDLFFQEHTVLHEIREIIEHVFCDLGSPISKPEEIEGRASEFASFVMDLPCEEVFETWVKDAACIESVWKRVMAISLIVLVRMSVAARAYLSANNPRL